MYQVYDQCLSSEIPLPELVGSRGDPDVTVRRGEVPTRRSAVSGACRYAAPDDGVHVYETPDGLVCLYGDVGAVRATGGEVLRFDVTGSADDELVRRMILGPGLRLVLVQQGHLVVHASAAVVGGNAVAFAGASGTGKSTTVAALARAGHQLLADDAMPIYRREGHAVVPPGIRKAKLDAETGDAVVGTDDEPRPNRLAREWYDVTDGATVEPARLRRVYLLDRADEPRVTPLEPRAAVSELLAMSGALYGASDTDATVSRFRQCVRLARDVPVARLGRPRSLRRLPDVVRAVEADLDG